MENVKLFGIDVSDHQCRINWETVKPQIDFAVIRIGWGRNHWDDTARDNIEAVNRLQIPYGAYWFSYAYTPEMAANEARTMLRFMEECSAVPTLPVYFDWEGDSQRFAEDQEIDVTGQLLRDMYDAFADVIKEAGYTPGLYAGDSYCHDYYGRDYVESLDHVWYALYGPDGVDYGAQIWQYTSKGHLDGISTEVDLDRCYHDYTEKKEEEDVEKEKRYKTIEDCPKYARNFVKDLVIHDELQGKGGDKGLDLSEDMIRCMQVMDRRMLDRLKTAGVM